MNCCDANGDCNQGRECPARRLAPINHGKQKRVEFATQGMYASDVARIKSTRPAWLPGDGVPPEAGNFQIVDLGPDDDDGQPLTHDENMQLVRTLLLWLLAVVSVVVLVSVGVGYSTERWAEVVWAYLARLS